MKRLPSFTLILLSVLALSIAGYHLASSEAISPYTQAFRAAKQPASLMYVLTTPDGAKTKASGFAIARYRLESSQSRFMVRAFAGGLLWFKGHDHLIAVRD